MEDDVVEEDGELAAFKLLESSNLFDFDPRLDDIATHISILLQDAKNQKITVRNVKLAFESVSKFQKEFNLLKILSKHFLGQILKKIKNQIKSTILNSRGNRTGKGNKNTLRLIRVDFLSFKIFSSSLFGSRENLEKKKKRSKFKALSLIIVDFVTSTNSTASVWLPRKFNQKKKKTKTKFSARKSPVNQPS